MDPASDALGNANLALHVLDANSEPAVQQASEP